MSEDIKNALSSLTGAKQTMMSWPRRIESYEALPELYKNFFKAELADHSTFPYVVLIPPIDKPITEKLIIEREFAIQVLERTGSQVVEKNFSYPAMQILETGNILLYSWITFRSVTPTGLKSSALIEFNPATGDLLLAPFLNKMRPACLGVDEADFISERAKFDYLSSPNFKFMNFGRNSLVRGEKVSQIVLQPEILEPTWKILGWTFYRTVTTVHLTILTDQELILIREDERTQKIKGGRYGGIWQFLPLRSLISASLTGPSNGLLTLTICLSAEETIQKQFAASSQPELERLCAKIQKLITETITDSRKDGKANQAPLC
ncbi:MAG: hypothetical protein NTW32_07670 [Chloroflexi bacterium]|nr:hypothetical protein [Chloroflexota bacterium]